MAWIVLFISGFMEAVWATALGKAEGLSKPIPIVVFILGLLLSMCGLAYAMKTIPTGTAYAVWTGIGAAITVAIGIITGAEPVSFVRIFLLIGLLSCVIGLKIME